MAASGASRRLSRKAVAVHEAGHLFVALALAPCPPLESVWIKRSSRRRWSGKVEFIDPLVEVDYAGAWREVTIALAGPVAEIRWRNSEMSAYVSCNGNGEAAFAMGYEASHDLGKAADLIRFLNPSDPLQMFEIAWRRAERLLDNNWPRLIAFADDLKVRERIEGSELHDLQVSPELAR